MLDIVCSLICFLKNKDIGRQPQRLLLFVSAYKPYRYFSTEFTAGGLLGCLFYDIITPNVCPTAPKAP